MGVDPSARLAKQSTGPPELRARGGAIGFRFGGVSGQTPSVFVMALCLWSWLPESEDRPRGGTRCQRPSAIVARLATLVARHLGGQRALPRASFKYQGSCAAGWRSGQVTCSRALKGRRMRTSNSLCLRPLQLFIGVQITYMETRFQVPMVWAPPPHRWAGGEPLGRSGILSIVDLIVQLTNLIRFGGSATVMMEAVLTALLSCVEL